MIPSFMWSPAGTLDQRVLLGNDAVPLPPEVVEAITLPEARSETEARVKKRNKSVGKKRYALLPEKFTAREMREWLKLSDDATRSQIAGWVDAGLIALTGETKQGRPGTRPARVWRKV